MNFFLLHSYKKCGPEMIAAGLDVREFGNRAVIVIREPFRAIWSDFQRGILLNSRTDHHVMKVNRSALLGNEFLWDTYVFLSTPILNERAQPQPNIHAEDDDLEDDDRVCMRERNGRQTAGTRVLHR
jgi:hypothetical protein